MHQHSRTQQTLSQVAWHLKFMFLIPAALLCLVFIHFDNEDADNTSTISGVVTDVEFYHYHERRRPLSVAYKLDGQPCFFSQADSGDDEGSIHDAFEQLEASGKRVTAIVTQDWHLPQDRHEQGTHTVAFAEEDGALSLEAHNKGQLEFRIIFGGLCAAPMLLSLFLSFLDIRSEIIVPAQKRKERRERKQAQKAKFADGQTVPQHNKNKKKKR